MTNWQAWMACGLLMSLPAAAQADIFRWDNGQLIPGTEGITPGPGVQLDHHELAYAVLYHLDLTDSRFDFSNLTNADLRESKLTSANLTGAVETGAFFSDTTSRGFTAALLYSTQSYQAKNLSGIGLGVNNLTGWDFREQNLTNGSLESYTLTNANPSLPAFLGALGG